MLGQSSSKMSNARNNQQSEEQKEEESNRGKMSFTEVTAKNIAEEIRNGKGVTREHFKRRIQSKIDEQKGLGQNRIATCMQIERIKVQEKQADDGMRVALNGAIGSQSSKGASASMKLKKENAARGGHRVGGKAKGKGGGRHPGHPGNRAEHEAVLRLLVKKPANKK